MKPERWASKPEDPHRTSNDAFYNVVEIAADGTPNGNVIHNHLSKKEARRIAGEHNQTLAAAAQQIITKERVAHARNEGWRPFPVNKTVPSKGGSPSAIAPTGSSVEPSLLLLLSIMMISTFLWRTLKPGFEFPSRTEQVTTIAVDLAYVVCLIALRARIARQKPAGSTDLMKWNVLFFIAITAGLGSLAIRCNGNASWWTGHLYQVNWGNDGFLRRR